MLWESHPSVGVTIMVQDAIRTLSERIRNLRQQRNWTQAELARRLNVHQKQISGYERGAHVPSTDVLIKMAQEFNCSLDFLAFDDREDSTQVKLSDREMLLKLQEIEALSEQDRLTIKAVLDTFLLKRRFQALATNA